MFPMKSHQIPREPWNHREIAPPRAPSATPAVRPVHRSVSARRQTCGPEVSMRKICGKISCIYIYIDIHCFVYMCVCMYVCMHAWMDRWMDVCMCM